MPLSFGFLMSVLCITMPWACWVHIHLQSLQRAVLTYCCLLPLPHLQLWLPVCFPDRTLASYSCPLVSNISIYAVVTCVVLVGEESSCIYLDRIRVQPLCFSSVCPGPFPWRTWLLTFQATWQEKLLSFFFCWISMFYRFCTPFFLCQLLLLQLSDFSVSLYFSSS